MNRRALGENIAREWSDEPDAPGLWDALQVVKSDPSAGIQKLEQLANSGSPLAKMYLGDILAKGKHGVTKNGAAGIEWLKRSAAEGSIEGEFGLAWHLLDIGNVTEALAHYEHLADLDYPPALYVLGSLYYKGEAVERNHPTALRYFLKGEALGHLYAANWVYRMRLRCGIGPNARIGALAKRIALLFPLVKVAWSHPNSDRLRI